MHWNIYNCICASAFCSSDYGISRKILYFWNITCHSSDFYIIIKFNAFGKIKCVRDKNKTNLIILILSDKTYIDDSENIF